MKKHNFTAKAITSRTSETSASDFKKLGTKFGISLATFALGAMLVMNIAGTNAVAPSDNPPDGDVDATFDNVYVRSTLTIDGLIRNQTRSPMVLEYGLRSNQAGNAIELDKNVIKNPNGPEIKIEADVKTNSIEVSNISSPNKLLIDKFGSISNSGDDNNPVNISDDLYVRGKMIVKDSISDSDGNVTIDDNLDIIGSITNPNIPPTFATEAEIKEASLVFKDPVFIENSLYVQGLETKIGGNLIADKIGAYFTVTKSQAKSGTSSSLMSAYAYCPANTMLTGCTGYISNTNAKLKGSYPYSTRGCYTKAYKPSNKISNSVTMYSKARCFDPRTTSHADETL